MIGMRVSFLFHASLVHCKRRQVRCVASFALGCNVILWQELVVFFYFWATKGLRTPPQCWALSLR
jgi:hypothetical protein